jgi:uncharacterized protein (UPF0262 family)
MTEESRDRLSDVKLDEASLSAASANAEHERRIAMFDLVEAATFGVPGADAGPYALALSLEDARLVFQVAGADGAEVCVHQVSLSPLRRLIKDYFLICDSYYAAIRDASPMQIEAIDMGRRGLHNDGADILAKLLDGKLTIDFETARRLFTLICALHVRT